MSSNPVISASGLCTDCGTVHSLSEGNSRKYALELMELLEKHKSIDFPLVGTPRRGVRGQFGELSLPDIPLFSTDVLFGESRGQMFGVLECEDAAGNTVVLKAFSGQYNGRWLADGWVPPIIDVDEFNRLVGPADREIKTLDRQITEQDTSGRDGCPSRPRTPRRGVPALGEQSAGVQELIWKRKAISQQLMKDLHALYQLTNFRGETRPLTEVFPNLGIPTGAGDCCAPKLLNYAAKNNLRPVGLSEFYWGRENRSGTRQHKQFYSACAEKCQPILGFMLCGTEEWSNGVREQWSSGNSTIQYSDTPILHADDDIVVVAKPSGLLAVPGKGEENQDCVVARIKALYPDCIEQSAVHRLDMDTSGLMVLALTADAHRELSRQFHDRETEKRYIALLDGELTENEGTIELPFRLDVDNRPLQIYDPVHGKTGITHWKTLGVENGKTRVEFFPITGRTHQLRVHAASEHGLGVPIVGDRLYGSGMVPGQLKLHASFLSFTHPRTGEKMEFRSAPPF